MNKDLILREYLALERTKLANERTLLSYLKGGLYFLVAGSTLGHVVVSEFWKLIDLPLVVIGFGLMAFGMLRYFRTRRRIEESRNNIGQSSDDFIRSVLGRSAA